MTVARTRAKMKNRASHADFIGISRDAANSAAFITLSHVTRALYVDLRRQYNGHNNGDICAADGVLEKYGWSHSTIHKHLKPLLDRGLIVKTRQGGIGAMSRTPCLYGFTDEAIQANPVKGISGAMPTFDYRNYRLEISKLNGEKNAKVHGVTAKVHVVNL